LVSWETSTHLWTLGVGVRTHGAEVKRLGVTDLGSEVSGRAQHDILGDVHVAGTSAPEYMAPSSALTSAPCIVTPTVDSKRAAK